MGSGFLETYLEKKEPCQLLETQYRVRPSEVCVSLWLCWSEERTESSWSYEQVSIIGSLRNSEDSMS